MGLREQDLTGASVRLLREGLGLSQTAFWKAVGVSQSVGSRYEADMPIPRAVRILIVATYVSGVKIDTTTLEGVAELTRLGSIQSNLEHAKETARDITQRIEHAVERLETAASTLSNL